MTQLLAGMGLGGYRSYQGMQYLGSLAKVNLIAGQNNAGKSNILRFVTRFLSANPEVPEALDHPDGFQGQLRLAIARPMPDVEGLITRSTGRVAASDARALWDQLLQDPAMHPTHDDLLWFEYVGSTQPNGWALDPDTIKAIAANLNQGLLAQVTISCLGQSSSDAVQNISALLKDLSPIPVSYTHLTLPTNREV